MRKLLNSTTALVTFGIVLASGDVNGTSLEFFNTVDDSYSNRFGFGYLESESGYQSFFQDGDLSAFETLHTGTAAVGTGSTAISGSTVFTGYVESTFASGVSRDDLSTFRTSATEELDGNGFSLYDGRYDPDFDAVVSTALSRASSSSADQKNFIYWVDTLDAVGGLSQSTRDTMASGVVRVSVIKDNAFTSGTGIVVAFRNSDGTFIAIDADGNQVADAAESDIIGFSDEDREAILESGGVIGDLSVAVSDPSGFNTALTCGFYDLSGDSCDDEVEGVGPSQQSITSNTTLLAVRAATRSVATVIKDRTREIVAGEGEEASRRRPSTGLNAGDGFSTPIGIWVDTTFTSLNDNNPNESVDGDTTTALIGLDVSPFRAFSNLRES